MLTLINLDEWRGLAISLSQPLIGSMSDMGIYQQFFSRLQFFNRTRYEGTAGLLQ